MKTTDTWYCPGCHRDVSLKMRGYLIGQPCVYMVCRNCWHNIKCLSGAPKRIIHGAVNMKKGRVTLQGGTSLTEEDVFETFVWTRNRKEEYHG